jgi:hypothetical protein
MIPSMRLFPSAGSEGLADGATPAGTGNGSGPGTEVAVVQESNLLKTLGFVSAALGAVAIGMLVGREIRQRYKFNRRTPYDVYSHSGDELADADWGVGI